MSVEPWPREPSSGGEPSCSAGGLPKVALTLRQMKSGLFSTPPTPVHRRCTVSASCGGWGGGVGSVPERRTERSAFSDQNGKWQKTGLVNIENAGPSTPMARSSEPSPLRMTDLLGNPKPAQNAASGDSPQRNSPNCTLGYPYPHLKYKMLWFGLDTHH